MHKTIKLFILLWAIITFTHSQSQCGNTVLQLYQECDDGNLINGDGCSENCTIEKDFTCINFENRPTVCCRRPFLFYDPSTRSCIGRTICGDGALQADEECDDGNWKQGDGCSLDCKVEMGFNCTNVTYQTSVCCKNTVQFYNQSTNECKYSAICQNGVFQFPQECDDGNSINGDGCSANCTVEKDFDCANFANIPSVCCRRPFLFYDPSTRSCIGRTICGDGALQADEECDDGNYKQGDGCSLDCKVEMGFNCTNVTYQTSVCCKNTVQVYDKSTNKCKFSAKCSNGIFEVPQECDDGNLINGDGCSENCTIEKDFNCVNYNDAPSVCCRMPFHFYDPPTRSCIGRTICGDGALQADEECDDGNWKQGDGCGIDCKVEMGFNCTNVTYQTSICCNIIGQIYESATKTCKSLTFAVTSFIKDPNQNTFSVTFTTQQGSKRLLFEVQGIKISTNFPYESVSSSFSSNTLTLVFAYNTSLNDASLAVTLNGQTVALPSVTDNNLSLKHYSSQDYSVHSFLMDFVPIFTYAALALLALTFVFASKAVAVETLLVLQFAYGGLLMMRKMEAGMHAYRALSLFNGYNAFADDATKVPPRVEGLDLSADFFSNFNYGLIVCLLPTVVGVALFLVHALLKRLKRRSALELYAASALGEWQLSALLVCAQQFIFAFVINIQYSRSPTAGIVVGSLLLVLYAFNGYRFCDKSKAASYGEFKKGVEAHSCNLYAFALAYRLSLSIILVAAESVLAQSLSLAWTVGWAAFVVVRRPYKKSFLRVTASFISILSMVLISVFYLSIELIGENLSYTPITLICLVGLALVLNTSFCAVDYYQAYRQKRRIKDLQMECQNNISEEIKLEANPKNETQEDITVQQISEEITIGFQSESKNKRQMSKTVDSKKIQGNLFGTTEQISEIPEVNPQITISQFQDSQN